MAHVEGNGGGILLHIDCRLAREAYGDAGRPKAAKETAPSQCLDRSPGTGKDGVIPHQVIVSCFYRLIQGVQIFQHHVAVGIPLHLARQTIRLLPVKLGGVTQVCHGIVAGLQLHAFLDRPVIVVESPQAGKQEIGDGYRCQHPAQPPEEVPAKQDHQADGHDDRYQKYR